MLAGSVLQVGAGAGLVQGVKDAQGRPVQAVLCAAPARGALTLRPDGSFAYAPGSGPAGQVTFTYRLRTRDGDLSDPITVVLTVWMPRVPHG